MNPKFKVGDTVRSRDTGYEYTIQAIKAMSQEYVVTHCGSTLYLPILDLESFAEIENQPACVQVTSNSWSGQLQFPAQLPQLSSQPKFKVGDVVKCLDNVAYMDGLRCSRNRHEVIEVSCRSGGQYLRTRCLDTGHENGWGYMYFELLSSDPIVESPEIYRAGEAAKASALRDKRKFAAHLLGLDTEKTEESAAGKEKENSIFECPYEAYDTKYGDW